MRKVLLCLIPLALLLTGCEAVPVKKPEAALAAFRANPPRSIVVVPVMNDSPDVTAPTIFTPSLTQPLAERGYYVFPVYLTEMLLRDLGLTEAGHVHQMPPQRFYDLFGADAVLLVTIKDWSTKYIALASSVVVEAEYTLKDTRTGSVLWQGKQQAVNQSGGEGLIGAAISAAVHALIATYKPLAQQANSRAFLPPHGLPAGPYHPEFGKDYGQFD